MMKKIQISTLLLFMSLVQIYADDLSWIEKSFANSVFEQKKLVCDSLFPFEGFEKHGDIMYVQMYNGELSPIKEKRFDNNKFEITNFSTLIENTSWSPKVISLYSDAKLFYEVRGELIILTIERKGLKEHRYYTSNVHSTRFATILEFEGWLLDVYMPNMFGSHNSH